MPVQAESQSLLSRVKSRLYVRARRPVAHLLEGQYASIHRGRSLDFDDLRDYQPGDEVGDIDWRASARHSAIMVRRYGAERRHRLLFAVAGGRNLGAVSAAGERKADLAVEAVGILGWLALQHGDEVGRWWWMRAETNGSRSALGRANSSGYWDASTAMVIPTPPKVTCWRYFGKCATANGSARYWWWSLMRWL